MRPIRSSTETPAAWDELRDDMAIYDRKSELYQPAERCQKGVIQSEPGDPGARSRPPRRLAVQAADLASAPPRRRAAPHPRAAAPLVCPAVLDRGPGARSSPAKPSASGACTTSAPSRAPAATAWARSSPPARSRSSAIRSTRQHPAVGRLCAQRAAALARARSSSCCSPSNTTRSCAGKKRCSPSASATPTGDMPRACRGGFRRWPLRRRRSSAAHVLVAQTLFSERGHAHRDRRRLRAAAAEAAVTRMHRD